MNLLGYPMYLLTIIGVTKIIGAVVLLQEKLRSLLAIKKMKEIDKWLEQFRQIWESRFNELDNVFLTIKIK